MVVSKHFTHFCYPIWLVLHQHLSSQKTYPGIIVCGLYFQVKCQDRLRINTDADKALAKCGLAAEVCGGWIFLDSYSTPSFKVLTPAPRVTSNFKKINSLLFLLHSCFIFKKVD